jgi:hypothetical protein
MNTYKVTFEMMLGMTAFKKSPEWTVWATFPLTFDIDLRIGNDAAIHNVVYMAQPLGAPIFSMQTGKPKRNDIVTNMKDKMGVADAALASAAFDEFLKKLRKDIGDVIFGSPLVIRHYGSLSFDAWTIRTSEQKWPTIAAMTTDNVCAEANGITFSCQPMALEIKEMKLVEYKPESAGDIVRPMFKNQIFAIKGNFWERPNGGVVIPRDSDRQFDVIAKSADEIARENGVKIGFYGTESWGVCGFWNDQNHEFTLDSESGNRMLIKIEYASQKTYASICHLIHSVQKFREGTYTTIEAFRQLLGRRIEPRERIGIEFVDHVYGIGTLDVCQTWIVIDKYLFDYMSVILTTLNSKKEKDVAE